MPSPDVGWLLRNVEVDGRTVDCRIRGRQITELEPGLDGFEGERVLDGRGGALIPGLADHHIHVRAAVAAGASVDLAGADLAGIDERHAPIGDLDDGPTWLRVIGAGVELSREDLDRVWAERPVRVQHRSGALWTLNSVALEQLAPGASAEELRTGQFWRAGPRLRELIGSPRPLDLSALARDLAAWGVTHLSDATPDVDPPELSEALPQHVLTMGPGGTGPLKLVIPDHDHPDFDDLVGRVGRAHAAGRAVAVHAITSTSLALTIAVFDTAGTNGLDRIEHAAICDDDAAHRLADLGITVVTQPSLIVRHGRDYFDATDPQERHLLWRCGGLIRAGVRVALSSDAPYGDANPWSTIHAAATRTSGDRVIGAEETIPADVALSSLLASPSDPGGPVRRVTPGAPADLCLLNRPLATVLLDGLADSARATFNPVRATFVLGRCIFDSQIRQTMAPALTWID